MITITKSKLQLLNACQDQIDLFVDTFGDVEVENTEENIQRAIDVKLNIIWLVEHMYPNQYEAIRDQEWTQNKAIMDQAWAQYKAIMDQAWAQYEAIMDQALAQYEAIMLSKCVEILLVQ